MAESAPQWDVTTDALVVGSGGGALVAALTARSRGLDVLVVEKTEQVGGSTAMSGGAMWIPNNPLMQSEGVPDSVADAMAYFDAVVEACGPASSPERRRAFVHEGPRMIAFLQKQGILFRRTDRWPDYYCDAPGGSERGRTIEALPFDARLLGPWATRLRPGLTARLGLVGSESEFQDLCYYNRHFKGVVAGARVLSRTGWAKLRGQARVANGGALVARLLQRALGQGAEIWTEAPFRDLLVEDGAVVGAVVRRNGRDYRIAARHGVLLAAGGFSRNDEMRARYGGDKARSGQWTSSNPGDTGEVLRAAMAVGAGTDLLDEAVWFPTSRMPDGSAPSSEYGSLEMAAMSRLRRRPGTIMVDAGGSRFANESMSYMELGQLMFARGSDVSAVPSWLIFDDGCRRRSLFGVLPGRLPERWIRDGFVKRADTLAELAAQCGIDAAGLEATVRRFNPIARAGVDDDFHRGANAYDRFMGDPKQRPNESLAPLDRSPFYVVAMFPGDVGTCGGLVTDERARVLRTDGEPIPGLYATGNTTATVMGRKYLGAGASIGPTCTFGFIAVNDIADHVANAIPPTRVGGQKGDR